MSTIKGLDSWAVDLKDVGAVYPFQGSEVIMVVIAIALWIGWHIWQFKHEAREIEEEIRSHSKENAEHNVDRY